MECYSNLVNEIFIMQLVQVNTIYHTSNSRECMGVNGEALQLHAGHKCALITIQTTTNS